MPGLVLVVGLVILSSGCGKRPTVVFDHPEGAQAGYYDKAWIDPVIIFSDSLYTVIRSDRIDSFYVDQPPDPSEEIAPSIMFQIRQESCFASISLLNDRGEMVSPLLAQNLKRGYYKVTCNIGRLTPELSSTGVYFLKAVYCDFQVVEKVTIE